MWLKLLLSTFPPSRSVHRETPNKIVTHSHNPSHTHTHTHTHTPSHTHTHTQSPLLSAHTHPHTGQVSGPAGQPGLHQQRAGPRSSRGPPTRCAHTGRGQASCWPLSLKINKRCCQFSSCNVACHVDATTPTTTTKKRQTCSRGGLSVFISLSFPLYPQKTNQRLFFSPWSDSEMVPAQGFVSQ